MTRVMDPSTLDLPFFRLFLSHYMGRRLIQLTQFFFIDFFFLISSFNIVFDWELYFMIYSDLFFVRLSQSHDLEIVLN
jgi:hypothetical protein